MGEIKIVWHKNPDTDSTISSIILSDYLTKKWYKTEVYIQGKLNKETKFLLDLLKIETPKIATSFEAWTRVALVDHNEKFQTLDNIDELIVEYIIDHHKIDFKSIAPLNIRIEKLCSTCSILYKMYKEAWFEINEKIAKMIVSWILSDSLMFKSATTTKEDVLIVEELKNLSAIKNLETYAMDMFNAKSDLWNISVENLIKYDYKEFEINSKKIWVGTLETTNPGYALWRKDEILKWLEKIKKDDNLDFILLSIVDIIWEKNSSIVLSWPDSDIIEEVFNAKIENNLADLKRRLSRKKQIIPELTKYFSK